MTAARQRIVDRLWFGRDPFENFPTSSYEVDHQGWNSHHNYLGRAIEEVRPEVVVEVGVWKGGSVLTMADHLRRLQIDGVVIAVDTWLGSSEHWTDEKYHHAMNYVNGYPHLYHCFVRNVFDRGLQDYVVPLPLDSVNAFHVLQTLNIVPQVLHIDAGHDFQSATNDLAAWWPMLPPGAALVGDDYFADGKIWPEVKRAFDTYFGCHRAAIFESCDAKCYIRKPLDL